MMTNGHHKFSESRVSYSNRLLCLRIVKKTKGILFVFIQRKAANPQCGEAETNVCNSFLLKTMNQLLKLLSIFC